MTINRLSKQFNKLSLALISIGYLWLWCFNRDINVLVKFMTMKAYFLVWLYFLMRTLGMESIQTFSLRRLFQMNFILQIIVTSVYWAMIHTPMIKSKKFPRYEQLWNVYVHVVPMVLLLLDFGMNKREILNNWYDTLKFYYFVCVPVNLAYSLLQRPVYFFLRYDSYGDYLGILSFGLVLLLLHYVCFWFLSGWSSKCEVKNEGMEQRKQKY